MPAIGCKPAIGIHYIYTTGLINTGSNFMGGVGDAVGVFYIKNSIGQVTLINEVKIKFHIRSMIVCFAKRWNYKLFFQINNSVNTCRAMGSK